MQPAAKGKTLKKSILESIRIPVPSKRDQRGFIAKMNRHEAKALALREQAKDIDKDKDDIAHLQLSR
ncbi:MAG: hypothetical protein KAX78_08200, partial [Phycisphaerae bacterium]|nr:hypothetical protein [Phycisphaerae bacterium]